MRALVQIGLVVSVAGMAACSGGTTKVSTKSVAATPNEVFWAKNTLAEQTNMPGAARFQNFEVMDLSNGDRVYCGEMNARSANGLDQGFVPFYMRRSGDKIRAVSWTRDSADFSIQTCQAARSGALRINRV